MLETLTCVLCGEELPLADIISFDGRQLCPSCYEEQTVVCERCGERIWTDDDCGDENHTLCRDCSERYYDSCADCGRLVEHGSLHHLESDAAEGYCESCYSRRYRENGVQSYCFKPDPIFYGAGLRYLGVELEIDGAGECDDKANAIRRVANQDNTHIYIKHDGSLEDGLEIVTHPMTLDYHKNGMPWQAVVDTARQLGYTSHQSGTCGLHVHVNRDSLGNTYRQQDDTIARILFLVENFWHELLRFSRRTQSQLDRWAARYGRKDEPQDVLRSAKGSYNRYTCVNLTPSQTIEFRIFRGTLKYNTIIATLQLVETICDVAAVLSDDEVKGLTWSEFVSRLYEDTTPELIQYLKERRLYVNEPVYSTEEEV